MNAGAIRHLVVFYAPLELKNAVGEVVTTYPTSNSTRWAEVMPTGATEVMRGNQIVAQETYNVSTRWFSGLNNRWRLKHGTKVLNIASVTNVGNRNREWQMQCSEVLDGTT